MRLDGDKWREPKRVGASSEIGWSPRSWLKLPSPDMRSYLLPPRGGHWPLRALWAPGMAVLRWGKGERMAVRGRELAYPLVTLSGKQLANASAAAESVKQPSVWTEVVR